LSKPIELDVGSAHTRQDLPALDPGVGDVGFGELQN